MKKSVMALPPINCHGKIKIYVTEMFMSFLERLSDDMFMISLGGKKQRLRVSEVDSF